MTDDEKKMLATIIARYQQLSSQSMKLLVENMLVHDLGKGAFVTKENKPNANEYFLMEGVLQSTIINHEGEYITTGFYTGGTVLTPHFARTIKGNSIFNLQAITPVVLAELPVTVLDSLRYSYNDVKIFGLKVVEQELLRSVHHDIGFRAMSAKERLVSFRLHYPNLENLVPHTIIASYLGITPVSFSRLRNEFARH